MTTDGDALFRAICENPAEDTPRLVYADWLQENGRPERAEFIRLQCEAWGLCPAHSTVPAARTRASELLRAHRDRWFDELSTVPGVEWSDLFVRGFIDMAHVLDMHSVRLTVAAAFAAITRRVPLALTRGRSAAATREAGRATARAARGRRRREARMRFGL